MYLIEIRRKLQEKFRRIGNQIAESTEHRSPVLYSETQGL